MVRFLNYCLIIFWILDITDMPFMTQFDTMYPLNGAFWILIWLFVLG